MATAPPPPFDTLTTEDWSAVHRAARRARRALDAATVEGRFANPTTETVMLANGHAEVGADERGAWIELHRRRLREGHWPSAGRLSRRNPGPAKGHLTRKTTMTTRRKSTKKPARKNGKRPVRKANGRFARKARPNRTRKAARPSARKNATRARRSRRNPGFAAGAPVWARINGRLYKATVLSGSGARVRVAIIDPYSGRESIRQTSASHLQAR